MILCRKSVREAPQLPGINLPGSVIDGTLQQKSARRRVPEPERQVADCIPPDRG